MFRTKFAQAIRRARNAVRASLRAVFASGAVTRTTANRPAFMWFQYTVTNSLAMAKWVLNNSFEFNGRVLNCASRDAYSNCNDHGGRRTSGRGGGFGGGVAGFPPGGRSGAHRSAKI